jgi:hypothetical protein
VASRRTARDRNARILRPIGIRRTRKNGSMRCGRPRRVDAGPCGPRRTSASLQCVEE